jgi:hypothetical protein
MGIFDKFTSDGTQFTSLKFTDGGSGMATVSEPLIVKPIPKGRVGSIINPKEVAIENRERVSKLLNNTGRGMAFVSKQTGLQLSNTRLEIDKQGIFGVKVNQATRLTPLHKYNKENTLSQIGEDPATGTHFDRFGLTPFMDDSNKYLNIVSKNNESAINKLINGQNEQIGSPNNRLVGLWEKLGVGTLPESSQNELKQKIGGVLGNISKASNIVAGAFNIFGGNAIVNQINNKVQQVNKLVSPILSPIIDQYVGGPDSVNGIGVTTIRRFDFTNNLDKINLIKDLTKINTKRPVIGVKDISYPTLYYKQLNGNVDDTTYKESSVYNITTDINGDKVFDDIVSKNAIRTGKTFTYEKRGTAGGKVYKFISKPQNLFNKEINIERAAKGFKYLGQTGKTSQFERNDKNIMSVIFTPIDPFSGDDFETISFSAYINGFKDNFSPTWNNISYIGRSEDLYVFNKFKRDVSFNLQIPCFSLEELITKHRALGQLTSVTAGKYGGKDKNKLGGVITRIKLGNYLNNEPGIITNISYDIPNDSSWDIDEKLAHYINVSISFTVIHNKLPQYKNGGFFDHLVTIEKFDNNDIMSIDANGNKVNKFYPPNPTPAELDALAASNGNLPPTDNMIISNNADFNFVTNSEPISTKDIPGSVMNSTITPTANNSGGTGMLQMAVPDKVYQNGEVNLEFQAKQQADQNAIDRALGIKP